MNLQHFHPFENCQKKSSILKIGYRSKSVLFNSIEHIFDIQFSFKLMPHYHAITGFLPEIISL